MATVPMTKVDASPEIHQIEKTSITNLREIGHGSYGIVHLAQWKNRDVAVKEYNMIKFPKDYNKSFVREVKNLKRSYGCKYIVNVLAVIEPNEKKNIYPAIIMEYCKFGSLRKFNDQVLMKCDCWPRKIRMIWDVCQGMTFLHTQPKPIIHRDLKCDNILVDDCFRAKVGDLGLGTTFDSFLADSSRNRKGTTAYFPPEVCGNPKAKPDIFWDIFSFGISLYEFTAGADPWPTAGKNPYILVQWFLRKLRPDIKRIPESAPDIITDTIKRCWTEKPEERPGFRQLEYDFHKYYDSHCKNKLAEADSAIRLQMEQNKKSHERSQLPSTSSVDTDSNTLIQKGSVRLDLPEIPPLPDILSSDNMNALLGDLSLFQKGETKPKTRAEASPLMEKNDSERIKTPGSQGYFSDEHKQHFQVKQTTPGGEHFSQTRQQKSDDGNEASASRGYLTQEKHKEHPTIKQTTQGGEHSNQTGQQKSDYRNTTSSSRGYFTQERSMIPIQDMGGGSLSKQPQPQSVAETSPPPASLTSPIQYLRSVDLNQPPPGRTFLEERPRGHVPVRNPSAAQVDNVTLLRATGPPQQNASQQWGLYQVGSLAFPTVHRTEPYTVTGDPAFSTVHSHRMGPSTNIDAQVENSTLLGATSHPQQNASQQWGLSVHESAFTVIPSRPHQNAPQGDQLQLKLYQRVEHHQGPGITLPSEISDPMQSTLPQNQGFESHHTPVITSMPSSANSLQSQPYGLGSTVKGGENGSQPLSSNDQSHLKPKKPALQIQGSSNTVIIAKDGSEVICNPPKGQHGTARDNFESSENALLGWSYVGSQNQNLHFFGRRIEMLENRALSSYEYQHLQENIQIIMARKMNAKRTEACMKFVCESSKNKSISGLMQLNDDKTAIHIAVKKDKEDHTRCCHEVLEGILSAVQFRLQEEFESVKYHILYLSPSSLMVLHHAKNNNLSGAAYYKLEELCEKEVTSGMIVDMKIMESEPISDILCQGYDTTFIRQMGQQCDIMWLPTETLNALSMLLDTVKSSRSDYRSLAKAIGCSIGQLERFKQQCTLNEKCPSVTQKLLETWPRDGIKSEDSSQARMCQGPKRTIGVLRTILKVVIGHDYAVGLLEKVLADHGHKVTEDTEVVSAEVLGYQGIAQG